MQVLYKMILHRLYLNSKWIMEIWYIDLSKSLEIQTSLIFSNV